MRFTTPVRPPLAVQPHHCSKYAAAAVGGTAVAIAVGFAALPKQRLPQLL